MIELRAGSATDVGNVRTANQDELLIAAPLFAVADGMGGAAAGEVAAATAIETLKDSFAGAGETSAAALIEAAREANRVVWEQAESNLEWRGMATTLVALASVDGNQVAAVNIGDSRLYHFHDGELTQVTTDHNLVAELVAEGRLSKEEAEFHPRRNIITRAIGVYPDVIVDLFMLEPHAGDRFVLCSDGLPRELRDDQIASHLRRLADPEEAAKELVEEAKLRGGNDNITVVVVDVVGGPENLDKGVAEALPQPASPKPAKRTRARIVTMRSAGFLLLLLLLLAGAGAGIGWYARGGYFVGLVGSELTVFQGRPGGLLWFQPTVKRPTGVMISQVEPRHISELQAGQAEASIPAALGFVNSLVAEERAAQIALLPPVPKTTTTTRPRTTPTTRPRARTTPTTRPKTTPTTAHR